MSNKEYIIKQLKEFKDEFDIKDTEKRQKLQDLIKEIDKYL